MRSGLVRLVCIVWALLMSWGCYATKRLNFTNYRAEQGLSSNYVSDLTVDAEGFLWIATDYGLNRFDGAVFRTFLHENYPSLRRNDILQVRATKDHEVLVSGYNGFFQCYSPKDDRFDSILPNTFYETVYHISHGGYGTGDIVARSTDGIYLRRGGTQSFQKEFLPNIENSGEVKNMIRDEIGQYWLLYSDKLSVVSPNGESLKDFKFETGMGMNILPLLLEFHPGRMLVSCQKRRVDFYSILSNGGAVLDHSVNLPFSNLVDVAVASDGSYWFASDGEGLWMSPSEPKDGSSLERVLPYGSEHGDLAKVYTLATDSKGNVWVGTQNTGLWHCSVLDQSSYFSAVELGMPQCLGNSFSELPSGNMLVACEGLGICEFSEKTGYVGSYGLNEGLKNLNVTGVSCDEKGNVWVTTWGDGLFVGHRENDKIQFSPVDLRQKETPRNTISFVVNLPKDSIWIGVGGEGMFLRHKDGTWERKLLCYEEEGSEPERWPSSCFYGSNNEVWLTTSFAMWVEREGKFVPFGVERFLNNDSYVVNDGVGVPGYGVVLATRSGLLVAKPGDEQFSELDICPKQEVSSVVLDQSGRLWAVVANSIWRFDLSRNEAKRYPKDFDVHGKNYFLKHAKYCSRSGRIYFGSKDGFFCFKPDDIDSPSQQSSLFLSRLEIDGAIVNDAPLHSTNIGDRAAVESIRLPYGHNSFSLCVDMPDFSRYRPSLVYRMGGSWLPVAADQRIAYSHLPAGSYLLEVKVLGESDDTIVPLKVEVDGPWWSAWWFRLLLIVLLLAAASWKLYALNRDKHLLRRMVDERTQELSQKSQLVEKRNMELNAALTTKDRLMAVVAHDLKNPVFAIVGALEGLRRKMNQMGEEERTALLDSMIGRAQTLQSELSKLLVWATSKQDDIEYRPSNVDLAEVIESDVELLKLQAEGKGVLIKSSVDVPNFVYVDARMISTAIRNVLSNSLKFTSSGRSVMVRAWMEGNSAFVELSDEGVGISNEKLQELLSQEVNSSTTGTDGESGTGLGIGLAKYYVVSNGGNFTMTSAEGVGTTTLLELPATQLSIPQKSLAQTSQDLSLVVDAELLEGNCVLVVDDDPLIAQNVKSMLESYVDVILAQNGQEALELLKKNSVDVVVSDVEMPVMNGIEMSNSLQSDDTLNHIPVLFLSARSTESDRLLGLLTGAVDYIPKPFNQTELLVKLNNILALRRRQQQYLLRMAVDSSIEEPSGKEETQTPADVPAPSKKMNPYLQRVMADIEANYYDSEYSVEQLASNLCTTRITLYRKVKSLSDQNPSDLLIDYRLNKSCQLLKEGNMTVHDVAFAVGFSDYAYFARRFKSRFGKSPKDLLPY